MLDFWTAVWWENTCSGLDRRTKADKCVQYWIGRFKKGDGRIAAGICSLASGCFWQESAVRLYSTCCTVHLIYWRFPKALKDIQDKTSFTDADAKSRAKNTEELHQAQFPSEAVTSWFRAGFLSKALKVGSQALSGLGGRPEEDEFVWCWIERCQKAYWENAAGDECRCLRIDEVGFRNSTPDSETKCTSRHFPNTTVTFEDWPSAAKENMMLNWSNREIQSVDALLMYKAYQYQGHSRTGRATLYFVSVSCT